MNTDESAIRRVRFYGPSDLGGYWHAARAAKIAEQFDPAGTRTTVTDLIELYNVEQYVEAGLLPANYTDEQRAQAKTRVPAMRSTIARFFTAIDDSNVNEMVAAVAYNFHADLLNLLGRNRAFARCSAEKMLSALNSTGVNVGVMLENKKLVQAYDSELRDVLMSDALNAEHLVRKHMQKGDRSNIFLPNSLTPTDSRELLQRYIDHAEANPNYIELIEIAPVDPKTGVDAKLKLRAKRRKDHMHEELFRDNEGLRTGCEVSISDTQEDPVFAEMKGMVATFTYGLNWLDETTDYPSILNNFQHLFEFTNRHVLLTLPAYTSSLGVFERFLTTKSKTGYTVGTAFHTIDASSLLQTRLYYHYLASKDIDLEVVISWFFERYLVDEFGASNLSFTPSGSGSSYLQKARHLFAEMESIAMQFHLYAENGELDRDLLTVTSDQVRYKKLASLLVGKYAYATKGTEITGILEALFSDQSTLGYISDSLKAENAAQLLIQNAVRYSDFEEYQRPAIDRLIALGILENTGTRVQIARPEQFAILSSLFWTESVSYYHLSVQGRVELDSMVANGWLTRHATLLTEAEGSYFNYYLNKAEFTNGPELRNKYLHGSQANSDGESAHFRTYITALKLIIALVIKINDDFVLWAAEEASPNDETA